MKLAWLTDIHLNFLNEKQRYDFYQTIIGKFYDAIMITGDIAEATSICKILLEMKRWIDKPIYFVLGNHDFYEGSVASVRKDIENLMQKELTDNDVSLFYMTSYRAKKLTDDTVIVGMDGFADGHYGDYEYSRVNMNDSNYIAELFQEKLLSKDKLLLKMQQLAYDDAQGLFKDIKYAIEKYNPKKIIVLTHIPPFPEVSIYEGKQSSPHYLPFFVSKSTGDILLEAAKSNPKIEFMVYCGHTHSYAKQQIMTNLCVTVGGAEYSYPCVQEVIII